jgi:hypothetical protein
MPTLESKKAPTSAKMLIIGDSGAGKTTTLAGLANAGFEVFIQDYDNGMDPLFTYVKPPFRSKVHYETLQDQVRMGPAGPYVPLANAVQRGLTLLNGWKESGTGKDYGSIYTWGPDRVLVFDSLTMMGNSALRQEIKTRGKDFFKPKAIAGFADPREIIGDAANVLEALFAMLFDERVKCHVILISHVRDLQSGGAMMGFPSAVGATLPKVLGRYFNTLLTVRKVGPSRNIYTQDAHVATKCPVEMPTQLSLTDGLPKIIRAIMSAGEAAGTVPSAEAASNQEQPKQ